MHTKRAATVALALLASSAVAQLNDSSVDIGAIDIGTKTTWCNAQYNSCNSLCGNPIANGCDNPSLSFNCTCANGSAPGLQYYIQTIPTFLCEQAYQNCIQANLQNSSGQDQCKAEEKTECGHLDPNDAVVVSPSTSSSSPSSTGATSAASNSATPTSSVSSSSSTGAAATMLALGREFGSGVIAVGVAAAVML
ncbi:hypothetical protein OIDMADRAFT_144465 [Oidiodendron maius Zn]|uniref:DUF7707 domain-containing protein n=1 Tax=Oidiodendron maius (strain Zn) TaxID=913774 RepID=A0A0C3CS31_OIDMZ|nr:hypothetical protein OIDMADRAFT_144465 [Oidiodendron maius Zn]